MDSDWMKCKKVEFEAYRMQGVKDLVSHMSEETYTLFLKDMKGVAHKVALISALCFSLSNEIDCYVSE